jgi:hypothetical protein
MHLTRATEIDASDEDAYTMLEEIQELLGIYLVRTKSATHPSLRTCSWPSSLSLYCLCLDRDRKNKKDQTVKLSSFKVSRRRARFQIALILQPRFGTKQMFSFAKGFTSLLSERYSVCYGSVSLVPVLNFACFLKYRAVLMAIAKAVQLLGLKGNTTNGDLCVTPNAPAAIQKVVCP